MIPAPLPVPVFLTLRVLVLVLVAAITTPPAFCQSPNPKDDASTFQTPPAPIRTPAAEIDTMELAEGYRLELVASEPLIQDPIAITFGPDGRLWVCEMRGFMPDIDGTDEDAAVGVISVLDDTDDDGVMDKSTVFLDGLVLPRGLCWTLNGILVCENGTIWQCTDIDGDDRCDRKEVVCTYNRGNLEHSLNGLMPALDNRIYNAKEGIRLQRIDGRWIREPYAARGQWGITQDDFGRLRYNVNASLLRGDLVPCYSSIAASNNSLTDVQLYDDQTMYPIRPNPGINRGYIPGFLRPDGSLVEANSNCGPVVYRGDNLPAELLGDVFIPEPAGNLIRRQVIVSQNGRKTSRNAYDQREFLASTDERFRPVNMFNSPDGTLYVVDMYRGVIQHGAYITPYLREQILSRQLDKGIHLGRVYRLAHSSTQQREVPDLSKLTSGELVPYLSHANGWHRDMTQQLLVQRGDSSVVHQIEDVAADGANPKGRLHALWTLAGLNRIDPELLYELLSDDDAHVRASAVTLYQRFLPMESMIDSVVADLSEVANDKELIVRLQVSQTLGLIDTQRAVQVLDPILESASMDEAVLDGLLGGFARNQAEFLGRRLGRSSWERHEPWRERLLNASAKVLWRQRSPIELLRFCHLLDSIPESRSWQQIALLEGIEETAPRRRRRRFAPQATTNSTSTSTTQSASAASQPEAAATRNSVTKRPGSSKPQSPLVRKESGSTSESASTNDTTRAFRLRLDTAPVGVDRLRRSSNPKMSAAANAFAARLIWPGKDGKALPVKRNLSKTQQELYELGKVEYNAICAGCHHPSGYGLPAKGPQLLGSRWLDNEQWLTRVVLHGVQGAIEVGGENYNSDGRLSMPGMRASLDDKKIAGVLTFIRREFVDDASPIDPSQVTEIRRLHADRTEPWTQSELQDLSN